MAPERSEEATSIGPEGYKFRKTLGFGVLKDNFIVPLQLLVTTKQRENVVVMSSNIT